MHQSDVLRVDIVDAVVDVAESGLPQLVDCAPETDVFLAVLLAHALGDLLEAGWVREHLLYTDCPATHAPLGGALHPGDNSHRSESESSIA